MRRQAFSSPVAMALGLAGLAVLACGIALSGLLLLAGDGRRPERVTPTAQIAVLPQVPPRAWSEPPGEAIPMARPPLPEAAPSRQASAPAAEPVEPPQPVVAMPTVEAVPPVAEAPTDPEPAVPVEGMPVPPRRDLAAAPFAGVWAPDPAACSPRQNRRGYLPAVIDSEGAWAGETSCAFGAGQQTGSTWRFPAVCSNSRRKWKADVKLTVTGDRLIWASQRGTQSYVRCSRTTRDT